MGRELNTIDTAQLLAIETRHQDIELIFNDRAIYAQAKAMKYMKRKCRKKREETKVLHIMPEWKK